MTDTMTADDYNSLVAGQKRVEPIKVARDEHMRVLDSRYPGYGLADHKGYPTSAHIAALRRLGPSPVHRRSFAPVQSCDSR